MKSNHKTVSHRVKALHGHSFNQTCLGGGLPKGRPCQIIQRENTADFECHISRALRIDGRADNVIDGGQTDLHRMLRFANMAAWIVTTRKGAIRSMPEREEVEILL